MTQDKKAVRNYTKSDISILCKNVSRGTFQRIINLARRKTADALVNGKTIRIDGGNFKLSAGKPCCRKSGGACLNKGCERYEACEENKI